MATLKDKSALKEWNERVRNLRECTTIDPFETPQDQQERIKRAKKDYDYFKRYYLPEIAPAKSPEFHIKTAKRVKRNKEFFGWLQWGRGLAKSVEADLSIPLWLWINGELDFLVIIGENEDKGALLLDDIRLQFEGNERIIHDFGKQKNPGHWEEGFFITKSGFIGKSFGKGQEIRGLRVGGKRPQMIVCDDWETKQTVKNPKRQNEDAEWLLGSIIPAMDGEIRRVLLAQNKFAPRMTFDIIVEQNNSWKIIRQNAFHPVTMLPLWKSKYPADYYKKLLGVMGSVILLAEYNNEPHIKGKLFKDEMIQWAKLPRLNHFDHIVGFWDVAYSESETADFNAVRVWGIKNNKKYLIDCFVKQCKLKLPLEWIASYQQYLCDDKSVQFHFEAQFWNEEIKRTISEVEKEYKLILNLVKHDRSSKKKYDRIIEMLPQYQNGRVYYNQKLKSHNDTKVGLAQLKGIEPGYKTKDDAPDADKYAFDILDEFSASSNTQTRVGNRENRRY